MKIVLILALFGQEGTLLSWPVAGRVTSGYGPRWGSFHRGIDISAEEGTWVRAAEDGLVIWAGEYGEFGNLVTVRHKGKSKTYYGHLKNYCVFQYQKVRKGQKLGRVGSTGKSTGPHLHFEVHLAKQAQDPLSLLPAQLVVAGTPAPRAVGGP